MAVTGNATISRSFKALSACGGIDIANNDVLAIFDKSSFPNRRELTTYGLSFRSLVGLTSLDGAFPLLERIAYSLILFDLNKLEELTSSTFSELKEVGWFEVEGNDELVSISGAFPLLQRATQRYQTPKNHASPGNDRFVCVSGTCNRGIITK